MDCGQDLYGQIGHSPRIHRRSGGGIHLAPEALARMDQRMEQGKEAREDRRFIAEVHVDQ
jgi:hypothetical protein